MYKPVLSHSLVRSPPPFEGLLGLLRNPDRFPPAIEGYAIPNKTFVMEQSPTRQHRRSFLSERLSPVPPAQISQWRRILSQANTPPCGGDLEIRVFTSLTFDHSHLIASFVF